ncbi:MAG: ABC transporter substrate-binding protein [Methylocystis sp.]|nr:ABC transporter substrate-binding protein [Methylocystis sp.]
MSAAGRLKIGFIPLADAATLFVAVDKGFAKQEGVDVELVREVSWSNIRDRLAIGHYDAAHLLAPMAIASTLGLSHVKAPLLAVFNLAMNGNAITVSRDLYARLVAIAAGDLADPRVSGRALKTIVRERESRGEEPLTFGMTFPFSTHNYLLRYWLAESGVDPDRDLRLIVLPPPFMVENLAKGHVDGFCVGAPWNAVAADAGVGVVLHPGCNIFNPSPEKTLAFRADIFEREPAPVEALIRACLKAADFVAAPENLDEVSELLARPERVGANARAIARTLSGAPIEGGAPNRDYLIFGDRLCGRPEARQAAWLFAQMARWGQARLSAELLHMAKGVFAARFFDRAAGVAIPDSSKSVAAFAGPNFDEANIETYLAAFVIGSKV